MKVSRRNALKVGLSSLAFHTLQASAPTWIARSANALVDCLPQDRILIILQHEGGIDGLNAVIPVEDALYYNARPTLGVPKLSALDIGDGLNRLHPRLPKISQWYMQGEVAVIQRVGYVNPNLSHFVSTDHYEFGTVPGEAPETQGWVSRFYGNACSGAGAPGALDMLAAGRGRVPDAMFGDPTYTPPAVVDAASAELTASNNPTARLSAITAVNSIPTSDPDIDFLQRSENIAEAAVADLMTAALQTPLTAYPSGSLGDGLLLASQIIRAGFDTRIFYVSQGGYDTHANQVDAGDPVNNGDHPDLLGQFDDAVDAFLSEMQLSGNLDRVLIMTFSEFGRRVDENDSLGTDHGAANCSFVFGGLVKGGIFGGQPDLADLQIGNMKHDIDFRSIYAKVIKDWLAAPLTGTFDQNIIDTVVANDLPKLDFLDFVNAVPSKAWRQYQ